MAYSGNPGQLAQYRGAYVPGRLYTLGEIVDDSGTLYVCKGSPTTTGDPSDNVSTGNWELWDPAGGVGRANLPDAFLDPTAHPNGALTAMTRGIFTSSFGNSPLTISSGAIVHTPSQGANTAGYLQAKLSANVATIGMIYELPVGGDGTAVLVIPVAAWSSGNILDAGVHATITATQASLARYESGAETNKTSVPLAGLTEARHLVEVVVDYRLNRVSLYLDGQLIVARTDATAISLMSSYAIWELFESNGTSSVPARILSAWATTDVRVPAIVPRVNATKPALPSPLYINYNTAQTWNIGTSYASISNLIELTVTVPPSGKVLAMITCYLTSGTAATYMRPALGGTSGTPIRAAESAFIGMVTLQQVITGTPGASVILAWQASCASGTPSVKSGGSSGGASVTAIPLPE